MVILNKKNNKRILCSFAIIGLLLLIVDFNVKNINVEEKNVENAIYASNDTTKEETHKKKTGYDLLYEAYGELGYPLIVEFLEEQGVNIETMIAVGAN